MDVLIKKTEDRKSLDTVPLIHFLIVACINIIDLHVTDKEGLKNNFLFWLRQEIHTGFDWLPSEIY
jgi:hypothetical protein